jgi:integrase
MPRRGKRIRLAKGIFRDESGISIILPSTDADGRFRQEEQRRPADSHLPTLKTWREDEIKKRKNRKRAGLLPSGTFAADAQIYLEAVTALPTYPQRCVDIGYWVAIFGHRRRDSIQSHEIRAVRDRWLTVGPKRVQRAPAPGQKAVWMDIAAPLSPQSVALRMRALENLWTVLDGKKKDNPVRDVPEPEEESAKPRGLSYRVVERILKRMPPMHPMTIRLHIMAYAGLAQAELRRVTRDLIDLRRREVWVPGRKKGRGAKGGKVPLSPAAAQAFRDLVTLDELGPFNTSTMWHFFQRYAHAAGYRSIRPYDLRHSFFTGVQAVTGDERALSDISRHASVVTLRKHHPMADHEALVTAATRHYAALDGLAAMTAAAVEGLSAAERQSHAGRLFCGLVALVDQQREQAAGLLQLVEDAADASTALPACADAAARTVRNHSHL